MVAGGEVRPGEGSVIRRGKCGSVRAVWSSDDGDEGGDGGEDDDEIEANEMRGLTRRIRLCGGWSQGPPDGTGCEGVECQRS